MRSTNHSKIKYWSEHLAAASQHPTGISAYCKANGLSANMYYKWKSKLSQGQDVKLSAFLPVTVAAKQVAQDFKLNVRNLPEAKWVAEVMLHLLRGLQ